MRLGIFFCGAMLSGAFGGLFAAGIAAAFVHNEIASWRYVETALYLMASLIDFAIGGCSL